MILVIRGSFHIRLCPYLILHILSVPLVITQLGVMLLHKYVVSSKCYPHCVTLQCRCIHQYFITVLSHRCLNAGAWPWRIPSHAFRLVGSYGGERQKAREREKKGCTSSHTFMHDALDSWLQGSEWHRENEITIARGRPQCHGSNAIYMDWHIRGSLYLGSVLTLIIFYSLNRSEAGPGIFPLHKHITRGPITMLYFV
ncbi:hypothetical protein O6H91_Y495400 [Diphasiastrum complanatum]|nr:hypothetical protein O6H91_Y495400 [Diphasiastrum complanatum]